MNEYRAMVEDTDREKSQHYQNHSTTKTCPSASLFMIIPT